MDTRAQVVDVVGPRFRKARAKIRAGVLLCLLVRLSTAQTGEVAARIYQKASPAVLVILLRDAKGSPISFGSGFLVAKNTLVTNFHVINGGSVFLSQGSVTIPARIERTDRDNDLAILRIDADIDASPLSLSSTMSSPGESVFAIGNPEGLEKSISTGIVSGTREIEGRSLLQITAPISHGSSGGPVLNSSGDVIGVSVGMLKEGQNLNFAIPASKVQALLTGPAITEPDVSSILKEVRKLKEDQKNQDGAAWQAIKDQIVPLLREAAAKAGSSEKLLVEVAEEAQNEDIDLAVSVAENAVRVKSEAQSNFALGKALRLKAFVELVRSGAAQTELLQRAKAALQLTIKQCKTPSSEMYFDLGGVFEDLGSYADAESNFLHALGQGELASSDPAVGNSLRGLVRVTYLQKRFDKSESWFKMLIDRNLANAWDWNAEGKRRFDLGKYGESGDAYNTAAILGGDWTNWCYAALSYDATDKRMRHFPLLASASTLELVRIIQTGPLQTDIGLSRMP